MDRGPLPDEQLAEIADLLEPMHGNFAKNRGLAAEQADRLASPMRQPGAVPSRPKAAAVRLGSAARAPLGAIGGLDFPDPFVFEHFQIALASLIEHLAERIGDSETASLARAVREEDEAMAASIKRIWTVTLAPSGLPVMRATEAAA